MPYYAKIVGGYVRSITQTSGTVSGADLVEIDSLDLSLINARYENGVFTPAADPKAISQKDFWKRFTVAEREALQGILATGTAPQKNKLNAFRDYVSMGGNVELDDDYIISSVTLMEQAGVIGAGRAAVILGD